MGLMNEVVLTFDHLSTQLTLVLLRIKVSKCKLWNPLRIFSNVDIIHSYILVTNDLRIMGVQVGFEDFVTHFLDESLFQNMAHIDYLLLLGNTQVALGSFFSCVIH
jgi:hypothetical protein